MDDSEPLMISSLMAWFERVLMVHGDLPAYVSVKDGCAEEALDGGWIEIREEKKPAGVWDHALPKRVTIGE